ncbi:Nitrate transporter 1.7 [Platanthera zijinensis]|uniref:Nitrate transporter 1.7 n=1 Tax=Platanthera zijinensis TaxID=2320716 RepID=A0AAP0BTN3_9ASPA
MSADDSRSAIAPLLRLGSSRRRGQRRAVQHYDDGGMNLLIIYVASIIGSTTIMFVEDSLSWGIGFRICVALTAGGLVMMIARMRFYRRTKAWGSAFTEPARVVVDVVRKRKTPLSPSSLDGFYCEAFDGSSGTAARIWKRAPVPIISPIYGPSCDTSQFSHDFIPSQEAQIQKRSAGYGHHSFSIG